jgi:hypothetical protein
MKLHTGNWIMGCLSLTSFAFLINGSPSRFFNASIGLKQGFPLHPFLFPLIIEGLSTLINEAKRDGSIKGIKVTSLVNLSNLVFACDIILFGAGSI